MTRTPVVVFLEMFSVALSSERFSIYLTNTTKQGRSQDFSRGTHNFPNPPQHLSSLTSFPHSLVAFAFLNSMVRLYMNGWNGHQAVKFYVVFLVKP